MPVVTKSVSYGASSVHLETGHLAKQASGAVLVSSGGTSVLVTAQASKEPKVGMSFLPLTIEYREKMSAAGRIPGGFFRREGAPRQTETLTARLIDRSLRPLFAEGWACETQVIANVISSDPDHGADALAMIGASAALMLSDIPFAGPIAGLRVCRIDGALVANPALADITRADINLFISCTRDAVVMVEGGANEASEAEIIDALSFAHREAQGLIAIQEELAQQAGKPKRVAAPPARNELAFAKVGALAKDALEAAMAKSDKQERATAKSDAKRDLVARIITEEPSLAETQADIARALEELEKSLMREQVLAHGRRLDGRGLDEIRPISCEVGLLPEVHGSALFTRGETQALVSTTLGTKMDEQRVESLTGDYTRPFMLHYNFPPYATGEVKFLRGPSRREVGHGMLAERALAPLFQKSEEFPYTVRMVSEILESNGSSSMASVCGASLALMDAGVPMKAPCAGIAMGLIKDQTRIAVLSDILGDEDHLGDMDFKVAGTERGITAIQMDIKIAGIEREILTRALEQARRGRLHILGEMAKTLAEPRASVAAHAPRFTTIHIRPEQIRGVIGPGGRVIRDLREKTGCEIEIEDSGQIRVASKSQESAALAVKLIEEMTQEPEMNRDYLGKVQRIVEFGAFVEILPGVDGLLHVSEMSRERVERVEDLLAEGDEIVVRVIGIERGKVRLSRKAILLDEQNSRD